MEKNKVDKTGLVLEGGGMRGIFTAGVLDLFLENNVIVDNCVAVSAGACLGASYMSKQYKRGFNAIADHINKKEYASFYNLITTGVFFDVVYSYRRVVVEFNLFDYVVYFNIVIIFDFMWSR